MRWLQRMPEQRRELLLALALTAAVEFELAAHGLLETTAQGIAAACVTLPLAVRFRWPLPTLAVVCAAWIAETALGVKSGQPILPLVAVLLALYAVGSRSAGSSRSSRARLVARRRGRPRWTT